MGAKFWDGTEWTMEVTDEQGRILLTLRFSADEHLVSTDPSSDPGAR
jgi:hypothetical protein